MASPIPPPDLASLLTPILPALPPALVSTEPADGVLPYLSPILRQRVKILSSASQEPWLRLLCYDAARAPRLAEVVTAAAAGALEPHPVSGEVEIDWDYDAETRFRRADSETLQALVALADMGLAFQLVYCVNDPDGGGGGDGWRVGEVVPAEKPTPFAHFGGASSIAEAERQFRDKQSAAGSAPGMSTGGLAVTSEPGSTNSMAIEEEDEDDGYWDRYDATPARTPANNRSPAPPSAANGGTAMASNSNDDDDYFAQYDDVQPAMDNHDPDEAAQQAHLDPPPLGLGSNTAAASSQQPVQEPSPSAHRGSWVAVADNDDDMDVAAAKNGHSLVHPRPESSASSTGSHTVAKLEASAGMQEQTEFGVKQHVSRSIRSLFQLSRSMGMERDEFEQLVRTELDLLGLVDEA